MAIRKRRAVAPPIAKGAKFTRAEKRLVTKKTGASKGKVGARAVMPRAKKAGPKMAARYKSRKK